MLHSGQKWGVRDTKKPAEGRSVTVDQSDSAFAHERRGRPWAGAQLLRGQEEGGWDGGAPASSPGLPKPGVFSEFPGQIRDSIIS